ncbi:hypothetical protein [Neobacillus jeddahensis]|uniref:hypothetical protein n=1 Tax=Neobacillus jeddahensis TaxID=1461580 RepID=UPI00058CAC62|nr:hypothetical protein [Neobacillus jeddahensis]
MNKKLLAGIGVSGAIMLGSVYSISANTSGYDLYKSALKETHTADSATMQVNVNLKDNNKMIYSVASTYKADVKNQVSMMSTQVANESEKGKMNLYKQGGSWYVTKDGDDKVYKMNMASNPHQNTAALQDDVENLIDVMTKNLQQQITVSEQKSGRHTIELGLKGKEIPVTVNAFSTLMIKHAVVLQDRTEPKQAKFHINPTIPELDHEITFKQIKLVASVNKDNHLDQQTIQVVVTGKDKQDTAHELVLNLKMDVTDYNQTNVVPVEIPTDKVTEIDMNHGHLGN